MNLQAHFNEQAIDMLPDVRAAIKEANDFERNQMTCYTLQFLNNIYFSIDSHSKEYRSKISKELLNIFAEKGWIYK